MRIALRNFVFLAVLAVATVASVQKSFSAPAPGLPAPPTPGLINMNGFSGVQI